MANRPLHVVDPVVAADLAHVGEGLFAAVGQVDRYAQPPLLAAHRPAVGGGGLLGDPPLRGQVDQPALADARRGGQDADAVLAGQLDTGR